MKDYIHLAEETKKDLESIGIKFGNVSQITLNERAKKRWGQCKKVSFNAFQINISSRLLEDDINDQSVKNVIAHELLHTVPGCFAHKGKWKLLAELVNSSLPNYKIKTTDSPESLGITSYEKSKEIKYTVVCTKCGMKIGRTRKSKLITNPERYRCAKCKGKLIVLNN